LSLGIVDPTTKANEDIYVMDIEEIEKALSTLNYLLTAQSLRLWQGKGPLQGGRFYSDFEHILNTDSIREIREMTSGVPYGKRIYHTALGHYLQYKVAPYEDEMYSWMRGAAAHIDGEKIYLKDIIPWCQKKGNIYLRKMLLKETTPLCKFLKPFALSYWEFFLKIIREEYGYADYIAYCIDKKGIDYDAFYHFLRQLMDETQDLYFEAMEQWARRSLNVSLNQLNRFDAIYILGLAEFDHLLSSRGSLVDHLDFFKYWNIEPRSMPGLHLDVNFSRRKSSQAMCFILKIPDEIYLVMNPQGGWIDIETLFHEMGHAFSGIFTSPRLPLAQKDFATSHTLSETYAFLLQNVCFSQPFLQEWLGLSQRDAQTIVYYKTLKDMSIFRRYVSKFLAEYRVFKEEDIGNGNYYSRFLAEYTGFYYQPEAHLLDMVPEFYSLDYVISWMAEAILEKRFIDNLGPEWMFKTEAGEVLKGWWRSGNRYELDTFFAVHNLGKIDKKDILNRWQENIGRGPPA